MTDRAPAIEARSLRFGYSRSEHVLAGLSFSVGTGQRVAILGANGSGKSTLLRCLSGSLHPNDGEVFIHGARLGRHKKALDEHRRRVQLVLQNPDDQLFSADVFNDVAFGPINLGLLDQEVSDRVEECLSAMGISDLVDRPVHHLSFGQRKRVAIAGALAMGPSVLLLDEPTAGLDPQGGNALIDTLEDLSAAGVTVTMSTHDVDLAWRWADEVAILLDGVIWQGDPALLLQDSDRLRRARLSPPWQLEVLSGAGIDVGMLTDRPRTAKEILASLGR